MSLIDTLIGNSSNANTNNTSANQQQQAETKNTTQNQSSSGNTTTAGTQVTNSGQQQKQTSAAAGVTSTLDAGTISLLQNLLGPLASSISNGNPDQARVGNIVQQLMSSAATPAISAEDIKGQQSAAVTSFNNNEAVDIGRLEQNIGSKNNTYSALVKQKGQNDLSATLGGITANAEATNAQIRNQTLAQALSGIQTGAALTADNVGAIAQIVSALKGATTTTNQQTNSDALTQILETLQNAQNVNTKNDVTATSTEDTIAAASGTSNSNTAGKQGSGLLGMLF